MNKSSRAGLLCTLLAGLVALAGCDASSVTGPVASGPPNMPGPDPASSVVETGAGVEPRFHRGNLPGDGDAVCKSSAVVLPPDNGWWGFKVDPPVVGTTTYGQFTVTISGDGRFLDWTATGGNQPRHVVVKGGPNTYIYDYDGSVTSDTGLRAPASGGGNLPRLSHFVICYQEVP